MMLAFVQANRINIVITMVLAVMVDTGVGLCSTTDINIHTSSNCIVVVVAMELSICT